MRGQEPYRRTTGGRPPATRPPSAGGRYGTRTPGRASGVVGSRSLARAGYSLSCLLAAIVLAASGFSYFVVRDVSAIGGSHAIASGPSIGAQNILLMGLESRRDWNGNILPNHILHELHAGSAQGVANGVGGNATNTLILIHIPAGGKKAVGFSIPRDDWVNFAGTVGPEQQGKVDQAYGVSMYYEQQKLKQQNPNISQNDLAFQGNEAGRTAAVATVEKLTGVHIDHFAEVNLDGFYELANVLGGVEVCLNHATSDANSGFVGKKGFQHLDAAQALAFVRQRDNLTNGDLDRTHRQQAFLDSVMHQLRTEGVLSDLSKMQALLDVGKQYVITDSGWNLLDFATQMRSLTGGNMVFHTLPIKAYATIAGQAANEIDPAYIQSLVQATFYPKPTMPSTQPAQTRPRPTPRSRRPWMSSTAAARPGWPGGSRPRSRKADTGPGRSGTRPTAPAPRSCTAPGRRGARARSPRRSAPRPRPARRWRPAMSRSCSVTARPCPRSPPPARPPLPAGRPRRRRRRRAFSRPPVLRAARSAAGTAFPA